MEKLRSHPFILAAGGIAALVLAVTAGASTPRARAGAAQQTGAVFLIIGENTSASQITPANAPYLTGTLKPRAAWITSYHSFTNSASLGNYIAMTSGQFTRCEANDDLPDGCHQKIDNLFAQLQRTGRSWDLYAESAANPCDITDHGAAWSKNIYSAHHNPALYYVDIHGRGYDEAITPASACRRHDLPMGTTGPDNTSLMDRALATGHVGQLTVLVPNDCENGHDPCGTKNPVRQFDRFVAREVPKIERSPAFGLTGTIIITWDEGGDPPLNPGNPLLLAVGAGIHTGTISTGSYNHYSLLRTLEDHFGLPHLGRAQSAPPLPIQ